MLTFGQVLGDRHQQVGGLSAASDRYSVVSGLHVFLPVFHVTACQGVQVSFCPSPPSTLFFLPQSRVTHMRCSPRTCHSLYEVVPGHTDGTSLLIQCYLVTRLVPAVWCVCVCQRLRLFSPPFPSLFDCYFAATTSSTCSARSLRIKPRNQSICSSRQCMVVKGASPAFPSTDTFQPQLSSSPFWSPSISSGHTIFVFHQLTSFFAVHVPSLTIFAAK